jgi:iron complex transport system substrate-binding protein
MRVVSLLPAATEIVAALGAGIGAPVGAGAATGPALVGVSHACDFPPEVGVLPRVTRTTIDGTLTSGEIDRVLAAAKASGSPAVTIDVAAVAALLPDVIIGQAVCDVCAVGADELGRARLALPFTPAVVTLHAHTLEGVFGDIGKVGVALLLADEAVELVAGMRYRLRRIQERRVSTAAHHAPARSSSNGWTLLRGRPLGAGWWRSRGSGRRQCPRYPLRDPHVARAARAGARARDRRAVRRRPQPRATRGCGASRCGRGAAALTGVEFLDGNAYTSRPGPRLVDAAEQLAALIPG